MQIKQLNFPITVCQVEKAEMLDMRREFYFVGKTEEEISLVCKTEDVPQYTLRREDGWLGFFIDGTLDFSLVGILANIAGLIFSVLMVYHGFVLVDLVKVAKISGLKISQSFQYLPLVICGIVSIHMSIFCIVRRIVEGEK